MFKMKITHDAATVPDLHTTIALFPTQLISRYHLHLNIIFYRNFSSTQQLFMSSNLLYLLKQKSFFPVIRRLAEYSVVTGPCLYEIALRAHKALYAKTHYMLFAKILQLIHLKESGSAD